MADNRPSATVWLVAGTLLFVAAPAHVFVIGAGQGKSFSEHTLEPGFQRRLVCWLVAAAVATGLAGWLA